MGFRKFISISVVGNGFDDNAAAGVVLDASSWGRNRSLGGGSSKDTAANITKSTQISIFECWAGY
jgi:hypothetical protein